MNLFSERGDKIRLIIHISVTLIGAGACLLFSPAAAAILLAVSVIILIADIIVSKRRIDDISRICDDIDRILRGSDEIVFDDYTEGAMSILTSEIQKMTVRLREQNADLHRRNIFLKEALEDISHQLRTPLTSMMLILGMLREPDLDRVRRSEYIQELFGLISRMQWLIGTMLSLSRLDAGAVTFRSEQINVRELIRTSLEPFSISLELKNIKLTTECPGDIALIGDIDYLSEAIGNIVKNCIEHTPENGEISVTAEDNAIYTGITVTDSGEGIAPEELPHIFERFYRSTEFAKKGYGIGLAFAQRVIAEQNGSLQIRSAVPHGAQFEIKVYKTTV